MKKSIIILSIISGLVSFLRKIDLGKADVFIFFSNSQIEGIVISETENDVYIETYLGKINIPKFLIKEVIKEAPESVYFRFSEKKLAEQDFSAARKYILKARQLIADTTAWQEKIDEIDFLEIKSQQLSKIEKLIKEKKFDEAISLYRDLIAQHQTRSFLTSLKKELSEILVQYAEHQFNYTFYNERAIKNLREAYQLNPESVSLHYLLSKIQKHEGRDYLAIWEKEKALELAQKQKEVFTKKNSISNEIIASSITSQSPNIKETNMPHVPQVASSEPENNWFSRFINIDYPIRLLLQAYNAGPAAVIVYNGEVPYEETINYLQKISYWLTQTINKTDYDELIYTYTSKYGLEFSLVKALIKVESDFNPKACSKKNARGLMQITKETWEDTARRLGVNWSFEKHAYDPDKNIAIGCHYLAWLKNYFLPSYFNNLYLARP